MMVAKVAALGALALAGLGLFVAATEGDIFLAASSLSALFVAALFWTLAEIGERISPCLVPTEAATKAAVEVTEEALLSPAGPHDLAELERKLAAKRAY